LQQRCHTITPGGWYASLLGPDREALWVALGDQLGVLQDRTNSIAAALNRLATIREGFDAVRSMLQRVLARGLPTAIKPWDPSSGLL